MSDDDMTLADIKRWYAKHGVPFHPEDWEARADTGESDTPQVQQPERYAGASVRSTDPSPGRSWWWAKQHFPWPQRTLSDKEWVARLDLFFAPYLALLPRQKGNLVRQLFGDVMTYQEVADAEGGKSRQAVYKRTVKAVRHLTHLIALDDPAYVEPVKRDPEVDRAAAQRVLERFLSRKEEA